MKTIKCKICGKEFSGYNFLKNHYERWHSKEFTVIQERLDDELCIKERPGVEDNENKNR